MSTGISGVTGSQYVNKTYSPPTTQKTDTAAAAREEKKAGTDYGRTVGKPQLSEKAAKYYEDLKSRFGKMDFVLVSKDQKENAKAMAGSFANPYRTVVLIDEEKVERMAEDENFRAKYENMIAQASNGLAQLKKQMESSGQGDNVKGYGLTINDNGTATYFAALKKTSEAQRARIAAKQEEKLEEAHKEKMKELRENGSEETENFLDPEKEKARIDEKIKSYMDSHKEDHEQVDDDTVLITANSVEDLMKKIDDYYQNQRLNSIRTADELKVGQHIDFRG